MINAKDQLDTQELFWDVWDDYFQPENIHRLSLEQIAKHFFNAGLDAALAVYFRNPKIDETEG